MHGFVLAGTHSNCGKTTITMGILQVLKEMGYNVRPFKVGPDYIDPMFHKRVTGKPSYNLDSFLADESSVKYLFQKHTETHSVAVVEGVMGLFDGYGPEGIGSASHVSKILGLPVFLIVNAGSSYQSIAAEVLGYASFDKDTRVAGVIINNVGSFSHFTFLKEIIEKKTGIPCIGYLPRMKDVHLESRHLGLIQANEIGNFHAQIDKIALQMKSSIDFKALLDHSQIAPSSAKAKNTKTNLKGLCIGVARDEAFSFYYKDNLEILEECGAKLAYFSPISDSSIPKECNALYFGGGYPELHAKALSENEAMKHSIHEFSEQGNTIYAECGGLMYLCKELQTKTGEIFPMTGIYNARTKMTDKLQRFGYAVISYEGMEIKCHEFHHSCMEEMGNRNFEYAYQLQKPDGSRKWQCGLQRQRTLATYGHIHFYSNLEFLNLLFKPQICTKKEFCKDGI